MVVIIGRRNEPKKHHPGFLYGISDEEYLHRIRNQIPLPEKITLSDCFAIDPIHVFSADETTKFMKKHGVKDYKKSTIIVTSTQSKKSECL
jgi:hypothetical protein